MDNVFAIGVGLALRALVDVVTHRNQRINGTLVGLWEGTVLHHFLYKFPGSLDPYVALGFRLLVDMLFTANVTRLTIVLLWTGIGLLLSDVSLDLVEDKRFRRLWRRIRSYFLLVTPTPVRSHVQFLQIPSSSSAASSNRARSPLSQPPIVAERAPSPRPPLTPARRPSTQPVPGRFSDFSETETEASRAGREPRAPSELDYISLPIIPDTPAVESFPAFDGRALSVSSRLTTSTEDSGPSRARRILPSDDESGLTTPVELLSPPPQRRNEDGLPPMTIFSSEGDEERTPTMGPVELPEPPLMRFPLRPVSDAPPELVDLQSMPDVEPLPSDMPDIPEPVTDGVGGDGTRTPRGTASRGPPPAYDEPIELADDNASIAESEGTMSSVVTSRSLNAIITRAVSIRDEALKLDEARAKLNLEYQAALNDKNYWRAFRLKVERDQAEQGARRLHAKAERRFFRAHNMEPAPQTVDVHRLHVPEAVARTEQALYDAMVAGAPELRIITGRGKHSKGKIPILKLAIIGAMRDHHIDAKPDILNSGVLLVRPPAKPAEGSSTA
ncbi:uncharacterized protein LAESUDRAFT_755439 [Laetiporus sulphureus 93-53]|uniref:Smr domain-containing protein n=1 Tax=Laetiporus sulphureus 93-53 TaxID=1314785 RepID=A0A165GSW7_9APHY|nr:uncharacterized protein LAESUDRAFT_755439 [Laetiporus sulphureus 93-53]KZT10766.1 hypothetical protein LAESUDRAFT_755439 [Laetiporus sulphureus 93-53]